MKAIYKIIIAIFGLMGIGINSQTPITLEEAYKKAIEHNLDIKNSKLRVDYQDKIKKSGTMIDPLGISAEIGQTDSDLTDSNFGISQSFRLPGFYKKQKQVFLEEWKSSLLSVDIQQWQLKRELSLVFSQLHYLDEKQNLLKKMDSIYTQYFNRADLRLRKGETNLLEKSTAENFKSQTNIQLFNIQKDKEITIQQLYFLINDGVFYTNTKREFRIEKINFAQNDLQNHWIIKQLEQQKNVEKARLTAEKSKLAPSITLGYNNMGMRKEYGTSSRFHSGVVGLNIPIFNTGQKAVIEGQKVNQIIAENNKNIGVRDLEKQYVSLQRNYEKLKSEVDYYEQTGLANARQIIAMANRQLYAGEINFLEWSILVNQALEIQNMYIDRVKELNDNVIEINSLFINE